MQCSVSPSPLLGGGETFFYVRLSEVSSAHDYLLYGSVPGSDQAECGGAGFTP